MDFLCGSFFYDLRDPRGRENTVPMVGRGVEGIGMGGWFGTW